MHERQVGTPGIRFARFRNTAWSVCALGVFLASVQPSAAGCGSGEVMTFADWRAWTEVTDGFVQSEGHSNSWVRIYVDDLAERIYVTGSAPYPECARIVKSAYSDTEGTRFRGLTVMVKMPIGYDPENADWWYGKYDESGTKMLRQGKLFDCIICHQKASETDYLFSREVMGIGHQ
jgi:hypothetical protein